MEKSVNIPVVGQKYHFYDDGKIRISRHYIAECVNVIPFEDGENIKFPAEDGRTLSLADIWKDECVCYDWLFANETDYFVCCSIPEYDENLIWFARTKRNGWFSMNIENCFQGGILDLTGELFDAMCEDYGDDGKHI